MTTCAVVVVVIASVSLQNIWNDIKWDAEIVKKL